MEIKVGTTLFFFDLNHREYERDEKGHSRGGPIWRKHWTPVQITSETPRSWVTYLGKIPKNQPLPRGWATDEKELDRLEWVNDNAYKISEMVRQLDFQALSNVAHLIGYSPESP